MSSNPLIQAVLAFPNQDPPSLPEPFLPSATGIHNLRRISDLRISNFPSDKQPSAFFVRPDIIYRSAEPSTIKAEGIKILNDHHIRTVFDLRSPDEIEKLSLLMPITTWDGAERKSTPCFMKTEKELPEAFKVHTDSVSYGFAREYMRILKSSGPSFGTIFRHIASIQEESEDAILVHCAAGKDRTGCFCALLLSLVGVSDQDVADEYALTEQGLASLKPKMLFFLKKTGQFESDAEVERASDSKAEDMLALLELMKEEWGSAEGYLRKECQMSTEEIDAVRGRLRCERKAAD